MRRLWLSSAPLFVSLGFYGSTCPAAGAQQEFRRFEIGAQLSTISLTNATETTSDVIPGFGGRLGINLTRWIALDTQLDFFPQRVASFPQFQGGRTLQLVSGARGKLFQSKKLAVYGLLRPGLIHFTGAFTNENITLVPGTTNQFIITAQKGPATHFMLDLGGGIEFYPARRWIARIEIAGDLYATPNTPVSQPMLPNGSHFLPIPGQIERTWRLSAGLGYRLGSLSDNEAETPLSGKLEFGPQFSTIVLPNSDNVLGARTEPGFGVFFSYRFYRFLFADGATSFFPREAASSGPHDGGRLLQGVYGLKAGIQRNRVGFFVKARPGFHSYSKTLSAVTITPQTGSIGFSRSTNIALDLGGVVEFYLTRHNVLRLDAGDTFLFFGTRPFTFNGQTFQLGGGPRQDSIQFSVGYGWRF